MAIILYEIPPSGPCRAVKMTAEHLGIPLVLKHVDLFSGEHMKPEFLAINPQHTVPVMDDDGFLLWESRAIMCYLVNKYVPDSPLYPKEPKARAAVDKMLHYDLGNFFKAFVACVRPQIFQKIPASPEALEELKKSLAILEKVLETTSYAAGSHLTLADYSIVANIMFLEEGFDFSLAEFPKISAWLQRMKKETPKYKEINETPVKQFKEVMLSKK